MPKVIVKLESTIHTDFTHQIWALMQVRKTPHPQTPPGLDFTSQLLFLPNLLSCLFKNRYLCILAVLGLGCSTQALHCGEGLFIVVWGASLPSFGTHAPGCTGSVVAPWGHS